MPLFWQADFDRRGNIRKVPAGRGLGRVIDVAVQRLDTLDADVAPDILGAGEEHVERGILGGQLQRDLLILRLDRLPDVIHRDAGLGLEVGHEGLVEIELRYRGIRLQRDRLTRELVRAPAAGAVVGAAAGAVVGAATGAVVGGTSVGAGVAAPAHAESTILSTETSALMLIPSCPFLLSFILSSFECDRKRLTENT